MIARWGLFNIRRNRVHPHQAAIINSDTQKQNNKTREDWIKSHHDISNPNGVSTAEIIQSLTLGREPNAAITSTVGTTLADFSNTAYRWSDDRNIGLDSKSAIFVNNIPTSFTITYSNLHNSYYYDNEGKRHYISKIVRTVNNATPGTNVAGNVTPSLLFFSDPSDGFWYNALKSVQIHDQYYDDSGNLITFAPNSAYITVTSLNHGNQATGVADSKIEGVTALTGKAISLQGSLITAHGNNLYADQITDDSKYTDWDIKGGKNEYIGAGVVCLQGNSSDLEFHTDRYNKADPGNAYIWATTQTLIPSTPGPQLKNETVHYHYDVSAGNCSFRTLLLQSSHSKFAKKSPTRGGAHYCLFCFSKFTKVS